MGLQKYGTVVEMRQIEITSYTLFLSGDHMLYQGRRFYWFGLKIGDLGFSV
jgi:hypothetical protein